MMLKKIEQYATVRPQSLGRSANVERMRALANLGQKVGDIAFGIGAKKRQQQGAEEGALAGQKAAESGVAPDKKLFPTIYGEAFNNSQQSAYLASTDRQAIERLNELENEFSNDVKGYKAGAEGYLKGLVKNAPEAYRPALNNSVSNYVSRGTMRINRNVVEQGQKEAKSELLGAIDTYSSEASRAARNGDFDSVDDLLNKAQLSAKAMVSGGFWTKEQADQTVLGARKEIFRQENKREILEVGAKDPEKAVKMLSNLEKEVPENHTPDEWERVVDDIRTDLARVMPVRKGGSSKKESADWLRKAKESLKFGFKLSDSDKSEGAALAAASGKQDEYVRLMKMEQFSLLPSKQRNDILGQMSGAETLESQKDYIELQAVHNRITKMAEEDGMTLAKKQGRLEPASMEGGDVKLRNEQAEELSEIYGTTVGPYMESEIQELVAKMDDITPSEKTDLAMSLDANERTYQQLDKKNAPLFAMVAARGDRDIANAVFMGQDLVKTKQASLPRKDDYMPIVEEYLGDIGEVYGIEDRSTIIKAALYHNASVGEFNENDFEKSMESVTGGLGEVNGRRVELPDEVSEDDLEDFMDDLQPGTIEQFGGLLHPFPIEDIRDGRLVSVGKNRYHLEVLALNNTGRGVDKSYVKQYDKNHRPFEITITPELIISNNAMKPKRVRMQGRRSRQ